MADMLTKEMNEELLKLATQYAARGELPAKHVAVATMLQTRRQALVTILESIANKKIDIDYTAKISAEIVLLLIELG